MNNEMPATDLLFVYGTLRRDLNGQVGQYHYYLEEAQYLGKARTRDKYALYAEEYALVFRGEQVSQIVGEVYCIANQEQAAAIDELEEGYDKVVVPVILDDSREIEACIYEVSQPTGELIRSGDYADFIALRGIGGKE